MKMTTRLFVYLILFLISNSVYAFEINNTVKLIKIIDGDTLELSINNNIFPVILAGIDCFEKNKVNRAYKQAYDNKITIDEVVQEGQKAKEYLEALYKNTNNVYLLFLGLDKYKRVLGIVYFDNLNVNEEMKINGYCKQYDYQE